MKFNYKNDAIKIFKKAQEEIEEEIFFLMGYKQAI